MIDNVMVPNLTSTPSINSVGSKNSSDNVSKIKDGKSFESILLDAEKKQDTPGELKFSSHALSRLQSRNIVLNQNDIDRINTAVDKAVQKGGKDTLVLMKDSGFIVDVKNRVVVTAMDTKQMKEHVFTNIDSAVIG